MELKYQNGLTTPVEQEVPNLTRIYRSAFQAPPYGKSAAEVDEFSRNFPVHAAQSGFRIVIGRLIKDNNIAGFAYGRTIANGQPWLEIVRGFLLARGADFWLEEAFQLVEMAVDPQYQGRGVGGQLHDRLLSGLPHKRAVLSTMAGETPASRFYRHRGWVNLIDSMKVPGTNRTYCLMGLKLSALTQDASV